MLFIYSNEYFFKSTNIIYLKVDMVIKLYILLCINSMNIHRKLQISHESLLLLCPKQGVVFSHISI